MAALAIVARPRLWLAGALLAVTVVGRPTPERAPTPAVAVAPPHVVIRLQPGSDHVKIEGFEGDGMNSAQVDFGTVKSVAPLAGWIDDLLHKLTGLGA